jgi:Zn-dependent oligopeptidase
MNSTLYTKIVIVMINKNVSYLIAFCPIFIYTTCNKLKAMKRVLAAYQNKRQLTFSLFDLRAHMTACDPKTPFNSQELWYNNLKEVTGEDTEEKFNPVASFGHLMGGYDAGYYGYLRSNTYAANMFYKWFKDGKTLDPESGMRYRKLLLEPGSTKDGIDLITDFLGGPPEDKYFLMDNGLLVEDK